MSRVHYFQRYSQRENVVTNNVLLLFSRLYHHSTLVFESVLNALEGEPNIEIGPDFDQQSVGEHSVPDGVITQSSFKIIIETKLRDEYDTDQLFRHLAAFKDEERQILLNLAPEKLPSKALKNLESRIRSDADGRWRRVQIISTTFESIIDIARGELPEHASEMQELVSDFEEFCSLEGLLPTDKFKLRVMACGTTLEDNFKYDLYYDRAERGYQKHAFLGIYSDKTVQGVGRVKNIVRADYYDGKLDVIPHGQPISEPERERIVGAMADAERFGYDIYSDHRFFLVDKFHHTDFKKTSLYGLQRSRYFDLREVLGDDIPDGADRLAERLRGRTWQ